MLITWNKDNNFLINMENTTTTNLFLSNFQRKSCPHMHKVSVKNGWGSGHKVIPLDTKDLNKFLN